MPHQTNNIIKLMHITATDMLRSLLLLTLITMALGMDGREIQSTNLIFRNFQGGDGLIDPKVNAFAKDCDGFIWLGTPSNVQRFDGVTSVCYEFPKGEASEVNAVLPLGNRQILAGTNRGIRTVDFSERRLIEIYPQISGSVKSLTQGDGTVYAATSEGVYAVRNGHKIDRLSDKDDIMTVITSPDGSIYMLSPDEVFTVEGNNLKPLGNGNISERFTCMADGGGQLLIGTDGKGVYSFDKKTKCFSHYKNVGNNRISALSYHSGMLAVGTDGCGLSIIPAQSEGKMLSYTTHHNADGVCLSFDKIKSLMVDNLGIIWIGYTRHVGFDYIQYHNKAFNLYTRGNKLPADIEYIKLYIDSSEMLITAHSGIYRIDRHERTSFLNYPDSISDKNATCLMPYSGTTLLGTTSGLYKFGENDSGMSPFGPKELNRTGINSIARGRNGTLLVGTDKGLTVCDESGESIKSYTTENSNIATECVTFIFTDHGGRNWVATSGGLQIFDEIDGTFTTTASENDISKIIPVTYMAEDNSGRMLLIRNRQHAFLCDRDFSQIKPVCTADNGFLGLFLNKILQDKDNNYWLIGSRGVVKGNPSLSEYTLFSSTEGFLEPYSNDGCIYNDTLYVTTPIGILCSHINSPILSAPTRLSDITVNGESRYSEILNASSSDIPVVLSRDERNIEFTFATLSYDHPYKMVYEYKLEGLDDNWKILRGINKVAYHGLEPGDYRFIVRKQMDNSSMQSVCVEVKSGFPSKAVVWVTILLSAALLCMFFGIKSSKSVNREAVAPEESPSSSSAIPTPQEADKYKFNRLTEEYADEIVARLKKHMEEEQPYLKPELKLINVADSLKVTPQILSQVLNTKLNIRFNDYINQLRIDTFKHYLASSDSSRYTLQSLAHQCGFTSYSTFYRAFKDATGQTPNGYVKQLNIATNDAESLQTII